MVVDLRRLSETQRRLITIGAGTLLILLACWVASQAAADLPPDERRGAWIRFTIAAVVVAPPMGIFVWRRLSDPNVADSNADMRRYFALVVGIGLLLRRQIGDNPELMALLAGASLGYVGSTALVYVYDLVTNRLSQGRSWHYPGDPAQALDHSSKTRSPT